MANRVIAGTVNADGTVRYGREFSVAKSSTGHYLVSFRPGFGEVDGGAATQIYPNDGSTLDNVVIINLTRNDCFLKTGDAGGNAQDRAFTFVFAGDGSSPAA